MKSFDDYQRITSKKTKRVTLQFNDELWQLFISTCEDDAKFPTNKMEEMILAYLKKKKKI